MEKGSPEELMKAIENIELQISLLKDKKEQRTFIIEENKLAKELDEKYGIYAVEFDHNLKYTWYDEKHKIIRKGGISMLKMSQRNQISAVYQIISSFLEHFDKRTVIRNLQGMLMAAQVDRDDLRIQIFRDAITIVEKLEDE